MLDFNDILSTPGHNVQKFFGPATATLLQWQTWHKPRGVTCVHMIAVGGGSSGGCGLNSATTSGGGAGGGSGAQSSLFIPASMLPDVLYVQAGAGGQQPAALVSAAVGVVGTISYVSLEPVTALAAQLTVLFANAGAVTGAAATSTTGGVAGTAAAVATIANMPFAGRGTFSVFAGQVGTAGGTNTTVGVALTLPTTGIMVTGGVGGGGSPVGATASNGGLITAAGLGNFYPGVPGGSAGTGATPAGDGSGGVNLINELMHYGGTGGGGAAGNNAAGVAGVGGNGALGCGGGGGGGSNTTATTLARPGNGGNGFVYIISW